MDGYIKIATEIDTKNFDAEIKYIESQMEDIEDKIKQADMGFEVGDVEKLEAKYSRLSKQLVKLVKKQEELNKHDFSNITKGIDGVGNSITKAIKKIAKLGLAIFGIRSAYMAVRSAMSTLSQYDDQMAANVEYIRYALANTLKPVIEALIKLAYKLLTYVNYIAKAWFGVDLFAKSSAKSFKKAKDGISATNKEAKKLSKQLAGFDEMNILQKDGSTSQGGGGGGTPLPSFDLAAPEDVPISSWLQWLADNGETVAKAIELIGFSIAGIKIANLLNDLGLLGEGFSNFKKLLLGLGIGLIIYGIYETIKGVIEFIKDPSWENFSKILEGLALVLAGVAIAMLAVNAANPVAWIILAIAAIVGLVAAIIKYWDEIKAVLGKVVSWINDKVIKPIGKFFKDLWNGIKNVFSNVGGFFKDKFTGAYDNIKKAFSGIKSFFSGIWNSIKSIFSTIGTKIGNAFSSAFKSVINAVIKTAESAINAPIKGINNALGAINKIPGVNIKKITEVSFPKLAKGGIINQPGRGVMLGSAIGGEKGSEGVIPLTDSQQMALLGEAIGKYVQINNVIDVNMDSRRINRIMQSSANRTNFAMNGR